MRQAQNLAMAWCGTEFLYFAIGGTGKGRNFVILPWYGLGRDFDSLLHMFPEYPGQPQDRRKKKCKRITIFQKNMGFFENFWLFWHLFCSFVPGFFLLLLFRDKGMVGQWFFVLGQKDSRTMNLFLAYHYLFSNALIFIVKQPNNCNNLKKIEKKIVKGKQHGWENQSTRQCLFRADFFTRLWYVDKLDND